MNAQRGIFAVADIPENWFNSGRPAIINGLKLRPLENPFVKGTPLVSVRGQARALYLKDENNNDWILKKFSPAKLPDTAYIKAIQPLIPHWPGLQSGYVRTVFSKSDLSTGGFNSSDFATWIENTILMPRIKCNDWATLADNIRTGSVKLTKDERLPLCNRLGKLIQQLEAKNISHRDLSATNVFVDIKAQVVHLIDWDCLFHPSLAMPPNTPFGTEGYVAAFVASSGSPDPAVTWRPHADRFSMAIFNSEFLCMEVGSALTNDGGMFEQDELFKGGGPKTNRILNQLHREFPQAGILLEKALKAQNFDQCPSPAEWINMNSSSAGVAPAVAPATVKASSPQSKPPVPATPQVQPGFVTLNEAAFVKLDHSALVRLL
jgi:serine/threonine protein kinase